MDKVGRGKSLWLNFRMKLPTYPKDGNRALRSSGSGSLESPFQVFGLASLSGPKMRSSQSNLMGLLAIKGHGTIKQISDEMDHLIFVRMDRARNFSSDARGGNGPYLDRVPFCLRNYCGQSGQCIGAYNVEETAARVYDLAAIKYWGPTTFTNFPVSDYETDRNNAECNKRGVLGIFEKEKQWFLKRRIQVQRSCKVPKRRLHMPMTLQRLNTEGDLGTGTGTTTTPQKFEILETNMLVSPCNTSSSSPTALGLLFRSSMFREMVEKNLSVTDYDTDKNEKKQSEAGGIDEFGGRFYNNMGSVEYGSSSNTLTGFQEENTLPLYTKTGHSLWNGALKFAF
ncbi:hypothetical protein HYC85_015508 [Camellia sinensis]|uniref:AP2/ERF domain-containing protein n=1 Tax=Camellia sinensis TaxID=4442 RepID=A0A7J7GX97_CAMSI|nr:hypothetical protein HYC85_015508 [Camellia sinensis]